MDELNQLITAHISAKQNLDKYKTLEKDLRLEVIDKMFPNSGEGTHTTLLSGLEIKCSVKMNYKFDLDSLKEWEELFTDEEKRCVKRTPSLDLASYRKLDEDDKMWIDDCITVTPALPSLTIKEIDNA